MKYSQKKNHPKGPVKNHSVKGKKSPRGEVKNNIPPMKKMGKKRK